MNKQPLKRFGCDPTTGQEDLKKLLFFKSIDWQKLSNREIEPPFKPKIVRTHSGASVIIVDMPDHNNNNYFKLIMSVLLKTFPTHTHYMLMIDLL